MYSSDNLFGHSKYSGIDPALTQDYESCVIYFVELSGAETAIIVIVVIISLALIAAGAFYVAKKYKDSRVSEEGPDQKGAKKQERIKSSSARLQPRRTRNKPLEWS